MSFIVCLFRKSQPRVSVEMCLRCRKAAGCEAYRRYREPFLFREMNRTAAKRRRGVRAGGEAGSPAKRPARSPLRSDNRPRDRVQEQTLLITPPRRP